MMNVPPTTLTHDSPKNEDSQTINDEQVVKSVRDAVARLNEALAEAARAGLSVTLRTTSHQTTTAGVEQVVVDARIYKLL